MREDHLPQDLRNDGMDDSSTRRGLSALRVKVKKLPSPLDSKRIGRSYWSRQIANHVPRL